MKQDVKEELSSGGVVSHKGKYLIGKHSGYHKWVLPKGLVEKGEGPIEAALREVEEEVGVRASVSDISPIKTIEYWYQAELETTTGQSATGEESARRVKNYQEQGGGNTKVHKKVIFYLMFLDEELSSHGWEMSERKWVSYDEGIELLAFESEREVLSEAKKLLG